MIRSLIAMSITVLLCKCAWAAPPKPIKALLVTGGCCHDYTVQKELIKKGLEQRAYIDVETVQQGGTTTNTKIPLYEKDGWADGFDIVIHDAPVMLWYVSSDEAGLAPVLDLLDDEPLGWAKRPGDDALRSTVNAALARWTADGTRERILARWIPYWSRLEKEARGR